MASLAERFEAQVDRSGAHHRWLGAVNADRGTGRLKVAGRHVTAHRVAWELAHGPLPAGARVLACEEEPACVRLEHLRVEGAPEPAPPRPRARDAGLVDVAADAFMPVALPAGSELEKANVSQVREGLIAGGHVTVEEIDANLLAVDAGRLDVTTPPLISAWGRRP